MSDFFLCAVWNRPLTKLEQVLLQQNPWRLFWKGRIAGQSRLRSKSMRKRKQAFFWCSKQKKAGV